MIILAFVIWEVPGWYYMPLTAFDKAILVAQTLLALLIISAVSHLLVNFLEQMEDDQ